MTSKIEPTAAICLIGDELLSGRTRDINAQAIARFLAPYGIPVREVRIVPDEQDRIVAAVNALRAAYTYVFTTGGIGPTHDDITADAIAAAFGVEIGENSEAVRILSARYAEMDTEFTPARRRMARTPKGADLISNPVSGAPGFQTGNVFTLAGVPQIVEGMLGAIGPRLQGGDVVKSVTVRGAGLREGDLAEALGELSKTHSAVSLGSYPWFRTTTDHGVALVVRGTDLDQLNAIGDALEELVRAQGVTPERMTGEPRNGEEGPRPGVD
ncbi:MAG: molybdopterin-binding protein [Pseudomonadota bacterium]